MTTEELLQSLKKILEDSFTWKIPEEDKWNDYGLRWRASETRECIWNI